jgi:hypothetical protein
MIVVRFEPIDRSFLVQFYNSPNILMLSLRLVVGVAWVEVALEFFYARLDVEDEGIGMAGV